MYVFTLRFPYVCHTITYRQSSDRRRITVDLIIDNSITSFNANLYHPCSLFSNLFSKSLVFNLQTFSSIDSMFKPNLLIDKKLDLKATISFTTSFYIFHMLLESFNFLEASKAIQDQCTTSIHNCFFQKLLTVQFNFNPMLASIQYH